MPSKGTRKSTLLSRRPPRFDGAFYAIKRFGAAAGILVFVLWLGAWVVLSGTLEKIRLAGRGEVLSASAEWGFAVRNILVEGRVHADAAQIRKLVGLGKGDPIFSLDPDKVREGLERMSWIKSARVERRLPDTIYIGVTERVPLALWQKGGKLALVDSEGAVLSETGLEPFKNLKIVVGEDAPEHAAALIALLEAEPALMDKVTHATRIGERRWDLRLKDGIDINLPEQDPGLALRALMAVEDKDGIFEKNIAAIDLRSEGRIIVRQKDGQALTLQAGSGQGI